VNWSNIRIDVRNVAGLGVGDALITKV